MRYYRHHIGDFNHATRHLTRVERSVYRDLIEWYYDAESPIPRDVSVICRKILAHSEDESTAVQQVLNEFFVETEYGWYHERCEEEIDEYRHSKSKKADAGRASAAARAGKTQQALNGGSTGAEQALNECSTNVPTDGQQNSTNHKPLTVNQQPVNKKEAPEPIPAPPEWINAGDWQAYAESRKRLRKPMTAAAARLVFRELTKIRDAGLDQDEALRNSVMNGWTGVFPPKKANNGATHGNAGQKRFSVVADAYAVIDRERARAFAGGVGGEAASPADGDLRTEVLVHLPGRSGGA